MDVTTGKKGTKDREKRGMGIQSEMQDFSSVRTKAVKNILKDCFLMINTTDKTKKEPLAHHGASSGMNPLSVSCVCWKSV